MERLQPDELASLGHMAGTDSNRLEDANLEQADAAAKSAGDGPGKDNSTDLALVLYDHIEGQIGSADTKASFTLVADSLLASAITFSGKGAGLLDANASLYDRIVSLLTVVMLVSFLVSVYYAIMVASPRLRPSSRRSGIYFFGYIAGKSEDQFVSEFLGLPARDNVEAILASVHAKSQIAAVKFANVRRSLNFFIIALATWALVQIMLAFHS